MSFHLDILLDSFAMDGSLDIGMAFIDTLSYLYLGVVDILPATEADKNALFAVTVLVSHTWDDSNT